MQSESHNVELVNAKSEELINQFKKEDGEVDIKAMASKSVQTSSQNKTLKKIIGFGSIGLFVAIGLMIASVMIGVFLMKETKVENGMMMTSGSTPMPIKTETAMFERKLSLYSSTELLDATKELKVPIFVDGMNSTLKIQVLSYIRVPGVKLTFFGNVYSVIITREGFEVMKNDPNLVGFETRGENHENVIFSYSRNVKPLWRKEEDEELSRKRHESGQPNTDHLEVISRSTTFTANADAQGIQYYGGPIIPAVSIYPVFWTSKAISCPNVPYMYAALVKSSIFTSLLPQYKTTSQSIATGVAHVAVTASNAPTSTSVTDSAIQAQLTSMFNNNILPLPSANNLYMIHFPPGFSITQASGGKSCVAFCGYHSTYVYKGTNVYYGVIPDLSGSCNGVCGSGSVCDNTYSVAAHEVVEAVTNPAVGIATYYGPPLSWYSSSTGEIADICNAQHATITTSSGTPYTIQKIWSVSKQQCTIN